MGMQACCGTVEVEANIYSKLEVNFFCKYVVSVNVCACVHVVISVATLFMFIIPKKEIASLHFTILLVRETFEEFIEVQRFVSR